MADHPATQWKSAVSSRRGSRASSASGSAKAPVTAPLTVDRVVVGDRRSGMVEMGAEAREPFDRTLARRQPQAVAPLRAAGSILTRHSCRATDPEGLVCRAHSVPRLYDVVYIGDATSMCTVPYRRERRREG